MIEVKDSSRSAFLVLRDQAQKSLDEATINFKKVDQEHRFAQQQLDLLNSYATEYQARLSASLLQGVSERTFANFQLFILTVEKSIEQQKKLLIAITVRRSKALQLLYRCKQKLKTYSTLIEKQRKLFIQQEQKRLQKQSDEFAQQQFIRRSTYEHRYH